MSLSGEKCPWILEANENTFQQDVVERSREILVVIDFWATWCQPCRLLGPIVEKVATEHGGKFLLVKADTDKLPAIASGFGVESIPAVYAMRDGQLLDYFIGLKTEEQFGQWVDRLLPSAAETLVSEAKSLAAADPQAAEAKYLAASELDPNLASAKIGLAALHFDRGRIDESRAILEELEKRGFLEPDAETLNAKLNLSGSHATSGDLDTLRAAVAVNSKDLDARLKLAEALASEGQYEEALETALGIVQAGKKEFVEPARQLMVDIFRLLSDDSPLVSDYRRRLSTSLS